MKIEITRHDLTRLLTSVTKVVETRNNIPILSHVVIAVKDGTITARGTDLFIEVVATAKVLIADDGEFAVDAKLLGDIAKKAGDDLTIELNDTTLTVKSGRSKFKLQTLPSDDLPTLTGVYDREIEIDLAALVAPVAFAISTEETRYYLNGVYLHPTDAGLVAVATDGHRLAKHVIAESESFDGIILPRKLIGLLPKGVVSVAMSATKIGITSGDGTIITSKLIDGTFPDYERVIPKANSKPLTVDRDALLSATERVSVISGEKGGAVRLDALSGTLRLSVATDGKTADEILDATFDGDLTVGFNSQYLGDALRVLPAGPVTFQFEDGVAPAVIKSGNLTLVLMPMRV